MEPSYTTRETVKAALDSPDTARADAQVDRAVQAASRAVYGVCKRKFYPEVTTKKFDWPTRQTAEPWRLDLYASDLYALTGLTSGGTTIPIGNVILESQWDGPPYTSLQISLASASAFSAGPTFQQAIAVTGTWGAVTGPQAATTTVGTTAAGATSMTVAGAPGIGVGSTLQVDAELVIVSERSYTSGGAITADVGASSALTLLPMASTAGWSRGDWALVDAERVLVVDVVPSGLVVRRAWDGTVLAAHTSGAVVYAPWVLTVQRGQLGTAAASHAAGSTVSVWRAPSLVEEYTVAHALTALLDERSGYARAYEGGQGGQATPVTRRSLAALEKDLYGTFGRMARTRVV